MSCVRIRFLHTEAFRLSAIFAGVFALSVLALGAVVFVITDHAFRDQVVQFSRADIAAMRNGYEAEGVEEAREVLQQIMGKPGTSDFFLLQDHGRRLAGNLPTMTPRTGTVTLPGLVSGDDVLGAGAFLAPGLYVFAGSDLHRVHAAEREILQTLAWLFVAAMLLAVAGGALVSRSFLQRSDAMGRACRAIMDGDLKARIPVRGTQDELDRLAGTINEMLDRIAALMDNLRQVTNDIAHDLRTPVSHLRQRLERARDDSREARDYAQSLNTAIEKTDEILELFASLLRIAQIEGGARRADFGQIPLAPLLAHMREMFGAVAEASDHHLELKVEDEAVIRGDRALMIQMLSNLIENAILHTPEGTNISVSLTRSADRALVTVSDDGPGVPPEEHLKLFQRLYRREASRSQPGYGLGLALVAAIAELHGASISVRDDGAPGFGITLSFPSAFYLAFPPVFPLTQAAD
jgi:signal transduction histidine kinase